MSALNGVTLSITLLITNLLSPLPPQVSLEPETLQQRQGFPAGSQQMPLLQAVRGLKRWDEGRWGNPEIRVLI